MFPTHFYTVLALCASTQAASQETETALTQRLLQDYVLSARPVKNVSLMRRMSLAVFRLRMITEMCFHENKSRFWV